VGKGTTRRSIRVEDVLWNAAIAKAAANEDNLSAVIRETLRQYVNQEES
jgi:hypothetical protein